MAAARATHSNCIFNDSVYAEIRGELVSLPNVLKDRLPNRGIAGIFADWAQLCDQFKKSWVYLMPIHARIVVWNPDHPETQKVKALWMQIFTAFQHQELDARETAIASFVLLIEYVIWHIGKEHPALLDVDVDEKDQKQSDLEQPVESVSSAVDLPPAELAAPAILFEDHPYAAIRQTFRITLNALIAKLDDPSVLESWPKLCHLFHELDIVSLHDQISAWNPEHEETLRVKALWMQIFTAFQHPNIDRREHVITAFFLFVLQMIEHDLVEERAAAGFIAPPTSPVEPATKTPVTDDTD